MSPRRPAALLAILLVTGPLPAPQPVAAVAGVPRLRAALRAGRDPRRRGRHARGHRRRHRHEPGPRAARRADARCDGRRDVLFGALRSWLRRQRFDFATEAELHGHLAARSDRDLRPIYDAFLADYAVSTPRPIATIRKARAPSGSP